MNDASKECFVIHPDLLFHLDTCPQYTLCTNLFSVINHHALTHDGTTITTDI